MSVDPQRPQATDANVAASSDSHAASSAATEVPQAAETASASGILISLKPGGPETGGLTANETSPANAYAHPDQDNLYASSQQEHPPQPLGPEGFQATSHRPAHLNRPVDHFRAFEEFQAAIQNGVGQDDSSSLYHGSANNTFGMNADMATVHFNRDPYLVPNGSSWPAGGAGNGSAYSERSYEEDPNMRVAPYENTQDAYDIDFHGSNGYQEQDENGSQDARTGPEGGEKLQYMSREKRALIESRLAQERPNRTLFVRNLDYNANVSEVKKMFDEYGDIQKLFSRIENRGMVFITYYDLRAAEYAKKMTHGKLLDNRSLDVHYSLPRDQQKGRDCREDDCNGTLFVYLKGATNVPIVDEDMQVFFAEYGDIKSIRSRKNAAHQRFVEFFDARACARAYHQAQGRPFNKGVIDVKFAWDMYKEPPSSFRPSNNNDGEERDERQNTRSARYTRTPSPGRASHRTAGISKNRVDSRDDSRDRAGTETAAGLETEARTGEQTLTVIETATVGTRAVIAAMIEDEIEAVTEAVIGVVVVVAIVAAIVVVIEMDMTKNVKALRRGLAILSANQGLEQKQHRPPPPPPPPPAAPPQPFAPLQPFASAPAYQPFLPMQSPAAAPSYNPINLSAQAGMEQAQKTQQFVNDILFNAGKPSNPSALSMFGQMSSAMAPPVPPAQQYDPRMPTTSSGMPPAAPSGTGAPTARSQAPSSATSGYSQGSSVPEAPGYRSSGLALAQSTPASSQPPPVAPTNQKANAEAQVQQLLQLLLSMIA
ncbi:hypothetical protein BGZ70_003283 [Mortierella alpina]|uniref:RRM domain-containing protein n=1 Tax=Mortierella alpina TaxID=64518 RepID=A0A9P6LWC3_MORAP|nr:hypothetical protein BGZ70_003283 [Mortierella alpina]